MPSEMKRIFWAGKKDYCPMHPKLSHATKRK